jgi:hypothetical protein
VAGGWRNSMVASTVPLKPPPTIAMVRINPASRAW